MARNIAADGNTTEGGRGEEREVNEEIPARSPQHPGLGHSTIATMGGSTPFCKREEEDRKIVFGDDENAHNEGTFWRSQSQHRGYADSLSIYEPLSANHASPPTNEQNRERLAPPKFCPLSPHGPVHLAAVGSADQTRIGRYLGKVLRRCESQIIQCHRGGKDTFGGDRDRPHFLLSSPPVMNQPFFPTLHWPNPVYHQSDVNTRWFNLLFNINDVTSHQNT